MCLTVTVVAKHVDSLNLSYKDHAPDSDCTIVMIGDMGLHS